MTTVYVSSGQTVTSATVQSGDIQEVLNGGTALNTFVLAGGSEVVDSKGIADDATIASGGMLLVSSGGLAFGDTISSFGSAAILSGGIAGFMTIESGAVEVVSAGGDDDEALLSGGLEEVFGTEIGAFVYAGSQTVESGGLASDTTISQGGVEIVRAGGVTSDTSILGGTLELASGATAAGTIIFPLGTLQIDGTAMPSETIFGFGIGDTIDLRAVPGGGAGTGAISFSSGGNNLLTVAESGNTYVLQLDPTSSYGTATVILTSDGFGGTDVTINSISGQTFTVSDGQMVTGLTVYAGATLVVASGGAAVDTKVVSGGSEMVLGTDQFATVSSGGVFTVSSGGLAVYDGILASGSASVLSGGVADFMGLSDGAVEIVSAGAIDDDAVLNGGTQDVFGSAVAVHLYAGVQIIEAGGVASATTLYPGSLEVVRSGGLSSDTSIAGGILELTSGAAASGAIIFSAFAYGDGTLGIDSTAMPTATISGFATGDTIDLRSVSGGSSGTGTITSAAGGNNLLTVSEGGVAYVLQLDPTAFYGPAAVVLTSDEIGGTDVTITNAIASGQTFTVAAGQTLSNVTVLSGGTLIVASGGTGFETKVMSGGTEILLGSETFGIVSAGGNLIVSSGASPQQVSLYGTATVLAGGSGDELIFSGGIETVSAGAIDHSILDEKGARQYVFGTALDAEDRGLQTIEPGGVASGTLIYGREVVLSGGVTMDEFVNTSGVLQLADGAVASGSIHLQGGTLEIDGAAMPSATITVSHDDRHR